MTAEPRQRSSREEEMRRLIAVTAVVVAVVAAVSDPGSAVDVALAAVPVAAFVAWAFSARVPLAVLTVAVLVPLVVAQRSGAMEPLLFEASLLAFVVARWARALPLAVALGLAAAISPVVVSAIQDPAQIAVGIWILGIAFPWALSRALGRQGQLAIQLEITRRELAEQALHAERRRIARDVHDLVGHGLAAMMLQVTSARHVLRRDPDAADEALRSAEETGRRSMHELRGTLALLRSDDDDSAAAPLPSIREISTLVDDARAGGLAVELRTRGDLSSISPGVGVAVYRIAQEALANAARHAPRARTVLELELADGDAVRMLAHTTGPAVPAPVSERERPRYGVIGMRERASALGGELTAGPTADGWRVSCRIPLHAGGAARA